MASNVTRWVTVWLAQIRYSLTREFMFVGSAVLWVVVDLCWFCLQLAFVEVLYGKVDLVAGWSRWELVLLVGMNQFIQQLSIAFFMMGTMELPELIRTGKLDFFLVQPVNTRFLISTRRFDPGGITNALVAGLVCVWALSHLEWSMTAGRLLRGVVLVVFGIAVHYSLLFFFMSLAFWTTRAQGFMNAYYNICTLGRQPREAFGGFLKAALSYGVPLLLVANLPSRALLGQGWQTVDGVLIISAVILLVFTDLFFKAGLKRYQSASS